MKRAPAHERGYDATWHRLRRAFLDAWLEAGRPCAICGVPFRAQDSVEVDHVVEVRRDPARRLDPSNLRALHKRCHRRRTARAQVERERGYSGAVGVDGWPTDPRHPMGGEGRGGA
jgi:5-methylcytosine-specific restriction endonuclease McrA